ncbi:Aerobic respiration control sensor protein ArcB [Planctomycetes bacterium Pan216]|uniref:Sensory/regulatory protein RpfC n=1 Tax=Kolteria novifilia TaxID=2527975 RepID=A0A518BA56_9BACT|nr:Aerobic respiration control sensor protein ArcB [Planctomycetes bacterium Pan216]
MASSPSDFIPSELGLSRHSRVQCWQHLAALLVVMAAAAAPFPYLADSGFRGTADLISTIEMVGALFGLVTGLAFVLRFYALGNRFHLFIGLAFFVNGVEDLVHGIIGSRDLWGFSGWYYQEFLRATYVTGQLLMGLTLLMALMFPAWIARGANRQRETILTSLIVLLITTIAAAVLVPPAPRLVGPFPFVGRPADLLSSFVLLVALIVYLVRYLQRREMLLWWVALSIGVNLTGQLMMLASVEVHDALFEAAHLYKVVGYLIPLLGFFLYQTLVVLEYQRSQVELIAAREEALAATRAKSQFLANVSHEIRTPMNGVIGMTARLLRSSLSADQRESLEAVRDSAQALLDLLNDVLDISKIEAGKLTLRTSPFSVRRCLEEATHAVAFEASEKGLRLSTDVDPEVPDVLLGDAVRLRQVLVNLLGNAVKFTLEGSVDVRITVDGGDEETKTLHITVRDTGIGISEEQQELIFGLFVQGDGSTSRRHGGTGLGLAIARQLVEMMNGELWVESMWGEGSTFHFTARFPLVSAEEQALLLADGDELADASTREDASPRPLRILLAEDNAINVKVAQSLLEDLGHEVLVTADGPETIELAQSEVVDLILLDLQMPGMGGLEVTRILRDREGESGRRVPIVALTAHVMKGDRQRCLEAGMDDYLGKPIDEQALKAVLRRIALASHDGSAEPEETVVRESASRARDGAESGLIDRARLHAQVRGDPTILREIVDLFRGQSRDLADRIALALAERDFEELARGAHLLAGSVGNFHALAIRQEMLDLEFAAKAGSVADCERSVNALPERMTRLLAELDQLIGSLEKPAERAK